MAPLLTGPKAVPFAAVRVRSSAAHQELCAQGSNQSGPAVPAGGFQGTTLSTRLSSTQPDAPHSASQGANSKGDLLGKEEMTALLHSVKCQRCGVAYRHDSTCGS